MPKETLMTLVYPSDGTQVLLGLKKVRISKGYYVGFGGRVHKGESIIECTLRELEEECGLVAKANDLIPVGILRVHNPKHANLGTLIIHLFLLSSWQGEPKETDEISPTFFQKDQIPWPKIRESDYYWLPAVLDGRGIKAEIWYNSHENVERANIQIN